jgi:hypothetical protein
VQQEIDDTDQGLIQNLGTAYGVVLVCKGFYRLFEKWRVSAREVSALFDLVKFESFDLLVKSVYLTLKR